MGIYGTSKVSLAKLAKFRIFFFFFWGGGGVRFLHREAFTSNFGLSAFESRASRRSGFRAYRL